MCWCINKISWVYQSHTLQTSLKKFVHVFNIFLFILLGIPQEELLRQQEAMFAQAKFKQAQEEWMQMQQQGSAMPQMFQQPEQTPTSGIPDTTQTPGMSNALHLQNSQTASQNSITTSVIQEPRKSNQEELSQDTPEKT